MVSSLDCGARDGEGAGVRNSRVVETGAEALGYLEVCEVGGARELREVIAIRRAVFTDEQHLTDTVDRDPHDQGAGTVQVLARLNDEPVGVGRLHIWRREGNIAWVAVLPPYRRLGVGLEIMDVLLDAASRLGAQRVTLSAQTHATEFYRLLGFHTVGNTWIMGGIEHILMVRELDE